MIEPGRLIPVIVCDAIIIIACFVRFWCKYKLKTGFHGDDWWTLLTVTSFIGAEVALFWGASMSSFALSLGRAVPNIRPGYYGFWHVN
jgi:hypothetical protein